MHACMYVCMYVCIHTYIYIYMYIYICTYIYIYIYMYICICVYIYTCVKSCVYIYICTYIYIYIYIYIYVGHPPFSRACLSLFYLETVISTLVCKKVGPGKAFYALPRFEGYGNLCHLTGSIGMSCNDSKKTICFLCLVPYFTGIVHSQHPESFPTYRTSRIC